MMLEVKHLSCRYDKGKDILKDVSFFVEAGEKVVVLGENGSGKTTLLRAVDCIIKSTGDILFEGQNIRSMTRREISKNIAFLTQISGIYYPYTVYETVLMGRFSHTKGFTLSKEDKDAAFKAIKSAGLYEFCNVPINKLSGGQLQRTFLARALVSDPKLILLDEPTNHLDLKSREALIFQIEKYASTGLGIVVVMHDVPLALSFADKALILENGYVKAFDTPRSLIRSGVLNEVFGVDIGDSLIRISKLWYDVKNT